MKNFFTFLILMVLLILPNLASAHLLGEHPSNFWAMLNHILHSLDHFSLVLAVVVMIFAAIGLGKKIRLKKAADKNNN